MVSGFEMRVGDAERDAAAAQLREHFASGRLTKDELNERLDQVFAARTGGDLHAVLTDLPGVHPGWSPGAVPPATPDFAGARRIGPQAGYQRPGRAGHGRPGAVGRGRRRGGARAAGPLAAGFVVLWVLLLFGILGIFGIGAGHPFAAVLVFAAFALLRRLIVGILRRRRGGWGGPRRRC